jgi:hypothetical protein
MKRAVLVALLVGCAPTLPPAGSMVPPGAMSVARCRVASGRATPLVTEWPASEKANLEALSHEGAVAVAYSGCNLRVLSECRLRGTYRWQRTTPATDNLEINNEDELYARLPLGAASLEGELKRTGKLAVQTIVSGQLKLEENGLPEIPASGACAQATHVVSALAVGAFALTSGATGSGKAGITVASLGEAGGSRNRSATLMRSAGDPDSCGQATDQAPHANCASPIQVFLTPIPGRAAEEGPPGAVKVSFVSGNPASRWDVYADDQVICTTPCARWVDPTRPIMLRTREGGSFLSASDRVQVPNLLGQSSQHLQLNAHGTANGELVTGITFTTFSGMAVITGITLTALGCGSSEHSGFCTGGLISLAAGAAALAGSLYLILDSRAHPEILPADDARTLARRRLLVGPGFLAGSF